ncbi:MAG: NAD-glutamate dehydrogenase [Proteobacteria bacterium]|nr:NAD-glutamate dehydrogenase [Pseudomonadota bacterium]
MENSRSIVEISLLKSELLRKRLHAIDNLATVDKKIKNLSAFQKFSEIMGGGFSRSVLHDDSDHDLFDFLLKRFEFLNRSLKQPGKVAVSASSAGGNNNNNAHVLEFVIKDRPFVVDSLLEYINENAISFSLFFHPIFEITKSPTKGIKKIQEAVENSTNNYSYVSCVIDNLEEKNIDQLKKDTGNLIDMLTSVTDDFSKISKTVDQFTRKNGTKSETLKESERRRLFTWLNAGNVILLGSGEIAIDNISTDLTWKQINNPLGHVKQKKINKNSKFPAKIGKLGRYFLESGLFVNLIEIDEVSTVHRRDRIQLLFAKKAQKNGEVKVFFFTMLFTNKSMKEDALAIPTARLKVNGILDSYTNEQDGYNRKQAEDFFSILPKSELFRMDRTEMKVLLDLSQFYGIGQYAKFYTYDQKDRRYARFTFIFPEERFSPQVFDTVDDLMVSMLPQKPEIRYWYTFNKKIYTHHLVWFDEDGPQFDSVDLKKIEWRVAEATMSWEEELTELLERTHLDGNVPKVPQISNMFSKQYKAVYSPQAAIDDFSIVIKVISENRDAVELRVPEGLDDVEDNDSVMVSIYTLNNYNLTSLMPFLSNMSLTVVDENKFDVNIGQKTVYIHDFHVRHSEIKHLDFKQYREDFCDLLLAVLEGETENDALNGLLTTAGLNRKDINLFIMYRNYYWQIGAPYLPINQGFLENKEVMQALRFYFYQKFDPSIIKSALPADSLEKLGKKAFQTIKEVKTLAEDIIFKTIFNLMESTIRTNFFNLDPSAAMAIKVHSKKVDQMPLPKPLYEIYIHGSHMEGIHLRGAKIARGGIRHSDRKNDFRTEVLGLMKAQMMKNVVIVPEGSKGGFFTKRLTPTRKELMDEGQKQYRVFMNSLLSLTDNIIKAKVTNPNNTIRYDDNDPYLVVAADKGTAHLSDTANEISIKRKFWLGDAFASGGSDGYDHKVMGITARGAWESVKLHFLEEGLDIQQTDFSVVGIGDMGGDVFGNGMLLSKHICLKGAFNHMHIFIDPKPKSAVSWKERKRLFDKPGSSWKDYQKKLISTGGGVFDRNAKSIKLTPEIKKMLGTKENELNGESLIKYLLKCKVDLLWNGGIGTYVKATSESALDVGDQANDKVRINGNEVRARVIGEGGNLGLTQLGRIEMAVNGGLLNTDAIDNSAGVDTSDHEVNLKILVDTFVQNKKIKTQNARHKTLEELTEEVATLVLDDNIAQGQILSMDNIRSKSDSKPFFDLLRLLTKKGFLDRETEFIPSDKQLEIYLAANTGIPKPVLAVLLSYTKMYFYKQIVKSRTLDDPYLVSYYNSYFPQSFVRKFDLSKVVHPLKNEIIGTVIVNKAINQAGITMLPFIKSIIDRPIVEIILVYTALDQMFSFGELREEIHNELGVKDINTAYICLSKIESFLKNALIWKLVKFSPDETSLSMVADLVKSVVEVDSVLRNSLSKSDKSRYSTEVENLQRLGISQKLAKKIAWLDFNKNGLEVIFLAKEAGVSLKDALNLSLHINEIFSLNELRTHLLNIEPDTRWSKKHRGLLMQHAELLKQKLSRLILHKKSMKNGDFLKRIDQFKATNAATCKQYVADFKQFEQSDKYELSGISVLLNQINTTLL